MNNKGFLLFEVMVSIVILTSGILFIARSYSSSKDAIQRSADVLKASLLLESKMWEYEEKGEIGIGAWEGDFTGDESYAWSVTAIPEETIEDNNEVLLVMSAVYQKEKGESSGYSVSTYLKKKK